MKYIAVFLLLFSFSCSSDDETPIPPKPNSNPGSIKIDEISFDGKNVTIDWSDAQDADGDQIFYKLYINSILIMESTESIGRSILNYNSEYSGRIIGTDKKGGVVEIDFDISTPKSKILFYTDGFGYVNAFDLYTLKPLWRSETSFIETHSVYGNIIYTGSNGINGLDILTGELLWTSTPSINYNREYRNIIFDESNVYAFDVDSNLHCVDKNTGGKLWERSFLDYYAPLTLDSEKVFVCSRNDDNLFAINKKTGLVDWSFEVDPNYSSAAIRINSNPLIINNNIYFGDNLGRFYSVNKNSGIKNWSVSAPQYTSFNVSPTLYENQIITGTLGVMYSLDLNTGDEKWRYAAQQGSFSTSPFIYKDRVYSGVDGNGSGELICLDAKTGQLIWKFDLESNVTCSPIVHEDVVYIGDWNSSFFAVNALTGVLDWKIKTEEVIFKSPTIVIGEGEEVIYPSIHGLKN
ncbi:MAG: hypothetical protein Mars2KO_41570 [Maribacter sp.]